jgi:hypothetical protein
MQVDIMPNWETIYGKLLGRSARRRSAVGFRLVRACADGKGHMSFQGQRGKLDVRLCYLHHTANHIPA